MTVFDKLKKLARKFPNSPGVYFWRDKKGRPIYIGRAGSLKKRVGSYFLAKREAKTAEMVRSAVKLDFQKTDTLLEAVILEANLIKKYWPKYNVEEKDDKSFIYLVVTNDEFPKPMIIRGRELERYVSHSERSEESKKRSFRVRQDDRRAPVIFGPYQSYRILRMVLELLRPIFPYSTCQRQAGVQLANAKWDNSRELSHTAIRPCFHYQIGLCPGVCINKADKKEYRKNIRNLVLFLRGDKKRLFSRLKKENPEKAQALQHVQDVSLLAESDSFLRSTSYALRSRIEGYDISHLSGKEPVGAMVVFVNGERDPSQYRLFKIRDSVIPVKTGIQRAKKGVDYPIKSDNDIRHYNDLVMLKEVMERRLKHPEWPLPDIVFVDGGLLQAKAVRDVLARQKIFIPVIGLSKGGKHAGSAYVTDKLVALNVKKIGKELLLSSKKLFQEVRNEAHRFAINFQRKRRKLR